MELKKTTRKISWGVYIFAFIAAVIIFGLGLWTGLQIEKMVSETVSGAVDTARLRLVSVETMVLLEESPLYCDFFSEELVKFYEETWKLGEKIEYMERRGVDPQLKIDYMLLETRDYLLTKKVKERCNTNESVILYFVSSTESECPRCWDQSDELTKVRNRMNVKLYSFDLSVESSIVNALKNNYEIDTYPTLLINGKKHEGFMKENEILQALEG